MTREALERLHVAVVRDPLIAPGVTFFSSPATARMAIHTGGPGAGAARHGAPCAHDGQAGSADGRFVLSPPITSEATYVVFLQSWRTVIEPSADSRQWRLDPDAFTPVCVGD